MIHLCFADETQADTIAQIIQESYKEQALMLKMNAASHPNFAGFESGERVHARLHAGDHAILFFSDAKAIGTISYQVAPESSEVGYIKRFGILPAYRRQGYGQVLMNHAEQGLQALGVSRAEISIVAQFEPLRRYYEDMGYQVFKWDTVSSLPFEIAFLVKSLSESGV
ncbi:MAG TPA: GNAT family N-acetyltransferase [Syntrophomonadaceae bacterium]|nr:GNAT family N-acetyltransferase [Syntrophomonadaceae bacterium]